MTLTNVNRNGMLIRGLFIMLCAGIINSTSVFVSPLATYYGWDPSAIANVGTTMLTFWPIGSIIGGKIMAKLGAKRAAMAGAICFGLGLILTGMVPKSMPGLIYFTFSFLIGIGNGIAYTSAMYAVTSWFPDKRGLASGLCMGVNGGSSAFLAPLCSYLTVATNIKVCLLVMGAACCIISIICGIGLQQAPEGYVPASFHPEENKQALDTDLESYDVGKAVKTRPFWHVVVCMAFLPALYLIMFSRFSIFMTDKGIDLAVATLGVSVYNIANCVGRFGLGVAIDKIGGKAVYTICGVLCLLSAILLYTGNSAGMILVAYFLLGCGFGATNSVYPVVLTQSFGPMYTGTIYGFCLLGYMIFTQITPRVAGVLIASTGGYTAAFVMGGVMCVIAVISMVTLPKLKRESIGAAE